MSEKNIKTTDFTLAEAVICCALYTSGSDGNFDETELNVIVNHPFFSQFDVDANKQVFLDLVNSGNLNDIMKSEFPKVFEGCDQKFKVDMINATVKIIIADGEIEDGELVILNFIGELMGLSGEEVLEIMKAENERMRAENERLKAKNASSSSGGCFVATATMGDYNHPVVIDLRKFRDKKLNKTFLGRLFIKFYYTFGPYPAGIISKSKKLRNLSLKYLIEPLHRKVTNK